VELQDYVRIIRKRWITIVLTMLCIIGVAALLTATSTKHYASTTRFFVSVSGADDSAQLQQGSTFVQQRVKSYAQLLKTPRALDPVATEVAQGTSAERLADQLVVTAPPNTVMLDVSVTDPSHERAQQIAESIGEHFPAIIDELERPSDSSKSSPVKVSLVQAATTSTAPVSPNPVRNLALGAVLGLLLGLGLAVLRHLRDTTVRTSDDVEEITVVPIIGAVHFDPRAKKEPLIVETDPTSPRSEAFRALRTNLMFVNAASHPRTIALTSSMPGEGQSTTIANLALTLAQSGSRVCLIEGDLRRPRLLDYLGLEGAAGITDVLIERATLDDVIQPYGERGLDIVGAGPIPPNPSELLASEAICRADPARLALRLRAHRHPAGAPRHRCGGPLDEVDGIIVLVGTTIVRKERLEATLDSLGAVDNNLLVLNRVGTKNGHGGGYYGYYDYQSESSKDAHTGRSAKRRSRASV